MSGKFVSFIASYTLCVAVEAEGDVLVITTRVDILCVAVEAEGDVLVITNNREDDDGFEYLRN
jgi:hypothetical protein